jgi:hypothetical protein
LIYEDLHLRSSPAGIKKRREKQLFWKLSEPEQIKILRDYFAMPEITPAQRKERRRRAEFIFYTYGLKQFDLTNAIKHFGALVTSVRESPEHRENHLAWLQRHGKL